MAEFQTMAKASEGPGTSAVPTYEVCLEGDDIQIAKP